MALFPGALPVAGTAVASDTLAAAGHTALHNTSYDEIRALATKLGTGASTPTASTVLRGTGAGTSAWGQTVLTTDVSGILPLTNGGLGVNSLADFKQTFLSLLFPVGSIYTNASDSTNPGTLLGFGTWTAFGAGRVPVGINASDTDFDTAGETGGAKTHTLTEAEMPAHTHSISTWDLGGSTGTKTFANTNPDTVERVRSTDSTGGGGAHNNLQPYIVVYMWQRTA